MSPGKIVSKKQEERMHLHETVFCGGYCVIVLECWPVSRFNFKEWLFMQIAGWYAIKFEMYDELKK